MKSFVLYVCVFSLISITSAIRLLPQMRINNGRLVVTMHDLQQCINQNNVTSNEMFKMHDILNDGYKEPGNEEKVRKHGCVFHCMMEKVGAMQGSEIIIDKIHNEVLQRTAGQLGNNAVKMVDDCVNAVNCITEKCQKTFELIACFLKEETKRMEQISREAQPLPANS